MRCVDSVVVGLDEGFGVGQFVGWNKNVGSKDGCIVGKEDGAVNGLGWYSGSFCPSYCCTNRMPDELIRQK
jgi:hypothetical protein